MKMNNKRAWIESLTDTVVAMLTNFPISMTMIWLCRKLELTVFQTSMTFTTVFTAIAIVRKYIIRNYFSKK